MASTIILKNGTSSAVPSALAHGDPAINVTTGLFYYGSGSGGNAKVKTLSNFTNVTASGNISSSGTITADAITATLAAGTSTNVVVLNSSNQLVTDVIDGAVFGGAGALLTSDNVNETLAEVSLSELTVGTATAATTVTVTDSNSNTDFPVVFHNESNALLDDTGVFEYNPSTGNLTTKMLRLTSTTDASATSTGHAFQSGPTNGANIIINGNEVMARNNGAVAALYINPDGGMVAFQNSTGNNVQIDGGHITASGIIKASGSGINAVYIGGAGGHITASGNISASGAITASGFSGGYHYQYINWIGNQDIDTNWAVPATNGPNAHSWNTDSGGNGTTVGSSTITLARAKQTGGFVVPFAGVLVGLTGIVRNNQADNQAALGIFHAPFSDYGAKTGTTNFTLQAYALGVTTGGGGGSFQGNCKAIDTSRTLTVNPGDLLVPAALQSSDKIYYSFSAIIKTPII